MTKNITFAVAAPHQKPVDTEIVATFHGTDKKLTIPTKNAYSGVLEKLKKAEAFQAKTGSQTYVRFGGLHGAESALFIGFGNPSELTLEKARLAGGSAWSKLGSEKSHSASVSLETFIVKGSKLSVARAFAEGMALACYEWTKYKSKDSDQKSTEVQITFTTTDKSLKKKLEKELQEVTETAIAVNVTRDWSNEPSNHGTPEYFAKEAQKLAKTFGLKCRILDEDDALKEKMGLFLGVGQGAEREGRIVVVEYTPKSKKYKTLALVGKGVTFDSGGISIKPAMRMEDMKHDMTGAATVMGALLLAAQWKVPNRVIGIMAFTENMPSGNAVQPGNVLTARSGKTVEIINTDAEGRLILADVLDFAQDMKPDAVVDVATLTGAVSTALGKQCCAILGNHTKLIQSIREIGDTLHERIWELPLYDDYFEDMKSDSADMKNSVNDGLGGTIRGAIFLKQFIRKDVAWAHLDIAATAYGQGHLSYYPKKGASGAYVRTLAQLTREF